MLNKHNLSELTFSKLFTDYKIIFFKLDGLLNVHVFHSVCYDVFLVQWNFILFEGIGSGLLG